MRRAAAAAGPAQQQRRAPQEAVERRLGARCRPAPGGAARGTAAAPAACACRHGGRTMRRAAPAAAEPNAGDQGPRGWPHAVFSHYLAEGRDWDAVEGFFADLVAGAACLSQLGLQPGGEAALGPGGNGGGAQQQAGAEGGQGEEQQEQLEQEHEQQQQLLQLGAPQRTTYKLRVAYLGSQFAGWSMQPGRESVEGALAAAIAAAGLTREPPGFREKSAQAAAKAARRALRVASRAARPRPAGSGPAEQPQPQQQQQQQQPQQQQQQQQAAASGGGGAVASAAAAADGAEDMPQLPSLACGGRTDAGVTAVGQVVSFYSWQPLLHEAELLRRLNRQVAAQPAAAAAAAAARPARGGGAPCLRFVAGGAVPRGFHATFSATRRRYVYLLPLRSAAAQGAAAAAAAAAGQGAAGAGGATSSEGEAAAGAARALSLAERAVAAAAPDVDAAAVDALLGALQGRRLDYTAFARDTPRGKDCGCLLSVARASLVRLPARDGAGEGGEGGTPCVCVEVVGDRFLRRMVRVLVATAAREAAAGAAAGRLVELALGGDRRSTASPAPAAGLCFAAVGYGGGGGG